ncbi:hypothetical protein EMO89_00315 [Bifidobacterium tissieri]|uniref:Uncharacterized protein n=1 Tax=Bifidobacterium tissieri TaxID=1630162 RepID=A0A5M9ZWH6_9BIFI|nr:hypothetical protein [Bifidobacterium tissieri]KAA8832007.1 hypothetical protein EMO89_00315 [Bifidobacterium tissieri]
MMSKSKQAGSIPVGAMDASVQWNLMGNWRDDYPPMSYARHVERNGGRPPVTMIVDWPEYADTFSFLCLNTAGFATLTSGVGSHGREFLRIVGITAACMARHYLQAAVRVARGSGPEPIIALSDLSGEPVERFEQALRHEQDVMTRVLAEHGDERYTGLLRLGDADPDVEEEKARCWATGIVNKKGRVPVNGELTMRDLLASRLH